MGAPGPSPLPEGHPLSITADCGGPNGYRTRLWKTELQQLCDETDLRIHVLHFPPPTSKWNKIEHRLVSFITQNWRGKPLMSVEVIIALIAASTRTGLSVYARLDEHTSSRRTIFPVFGETLGKRHARQDSELQFTQGNMEP